MSIDDSTQVSNPTVDGENIVHAANTAPNPNRDGMGLQSITAPKNKVITGKEASEP
jgi:hypothetical protein